MEHNFLTAEQRIEAYLDQVLVPLTRRLSPFHRAELRRELRAHLWERIEAYQELGQPEENAVAEALRQFGGAEDFTRQWQHEWVMLAQVGTFQAITAASWAALRLCAPLLAASWAVARLLSFLVISALPSTYPGALMVIYCDSLFPLCTAGFFFLSLWCGFVQGSRSKRWGGIGMFAALGVIVAAGSALYEVAAIAGLDGSVLGGLLMSLPLMAAAWMPTACLAAVLGGWRARSRKRVLA